MNGDVSWYYLNKISISTAFLAAARILVPWVPEDVFSRVEKGEMPRCHLQPKAKATSGESSSKNTSLALVTIKS